jgi:macrolide transport system ATP-binding/permease protein
MALLALRNIQLNYRLDGRPLQVLKNVELDIERGEMVGILGPSGSGKSTLLYILGCLLKPTTGSFRFGGHEITALDHDQLALLRSREIGFVFQQFHLLPRADVFENVMMAARYKRDDTRSEAQVRTKAMQLIESVGLTSHITHKPNQLSGGQQQRVAIARALINDPALILADEPTGNLDSIAAAQVLEVLREIHKAGRTVVIITHDRDVAGRCDRVVQIRDGVMEAANAESQPEIPTHKFPRSRSEGLTFGSWIRYSRAALINLERNKARSFLTMLGVTIGIAAVLSTITLGGYTRTKILQTYETLGVNKLVIRAWENWRLKATDIRGVKFEGVSQENDIVPMRRLFPEIALLSPVIQDGRLRSAEYGGRVDEQIRVLGVSNEYFSITNRKFLIGHAFTPFHVQNRRAVCVIGFEVATKLFGRSNPLEQMVVLKGDDNRVVSCLVLGVLQTQSTNDEWSNPNQQIILPDSFLSIMASQWYNKPHEFDMQMRAGSSMDDLATKVKAFLKLKYGKTVQVRVDSDEILVAQMRRFLNLFAVLLAAVAFISLAVGGIGITNMMLVSVAERFKEIGLRKALGARDSEIRMQFLVEAIILCAFAGLIGVLIGVCGYHLMLYLAAKLFAKIHFEWVFNWTAIALSAACIFVVGVASGIVPAIRAEKLEVVEALRSE